MKKGIIVAVLITLSLILVSPLKIKASWVPGWAETIPAPTNIIYYECNGTNSCPKTYNTYVDYFSSPTTERGFVTTDVAMNIGTNGYAIQYPTSTLKKDYIYNVNYYICANKVFSATNYSIYSSGYQIFTNNNIYNSITRSSIGTEPVIDGGRTFNNCQFFSGLLVPEVDTTWVTFRIKKRETTISGIYISTIGVEVKELGLYNSALEDVIKNSGFATSESVEQVQESVTKIENEITGEFETPTEPSEEIQGKEELDNLKDKEEKLIGNLDFSGAENIEVTINPETSSFIWEMIERIRNMNGKIILFITSILSLGIIKLILNR